MFPPLCLPVGGRAEVVAPVRAEPTSDRHCGGSAPKTKGFAGLRLSIHAEGACGSAGSAGRRPISKLPRLLTRAGCMFVRTSKGSHEIWCSPHKVPVGITAAIQRTVSLGRPACRKPFEALALASKELRYRGINAIGRNMLIVPSPVTHTARRHAQRLCVARMAGQTFPGVAGMSM